jgi:L,D-transpeptidase ErfK/SrfK
LCAPGLGHTGGFRYELPSRGKDPMSWETVVGFIQGHTVEDQDTFLDIARKYGLGFNEMELLYPQFDAWLPPVGSRLLIPTQWVLPETKKEEVVINIAEMRLYRFFPRVRMVKTYPVGIGDEGWHTPVGIYKIVDRQVDPAWSVPKSLREKYGVSLMPPGPENPLGRHWLGLSRKGYGIHGTNFPWAVGRLVTHGCIRLYPEHMEMFFQETPVGTAVELIYEPVKIGFRRGEVFVEVHPDIYGKLPDLSEYARRRFQQSGLWPFISPEELEQAVRKRDGVPVRVGVLDKGRPVNLAWGGQQALKRFHGPSPRGGRSMA